MNIIAIAQHLSIAADAIITVEEWATVLWVKFQGGCKFVSKKIMNTKATSKLQIKVHKNQGQHSNEICAELSGVVNVIERRAIALDAEVYSWHWIAYENHLSDWGLKKRALRSMVKYAERFGDSDLLNAVKDLKEEDVVFA